MGSGCGITNTALLILTLGVNRTINKKADKLGMIYHVLPLMLQGTMGIINSKRGVVEYDYNDYKEFGILTKKIAQPILRYAKDASRKEGFWEKHVVLNIICVWGCSINCYKDSGSFCDYLLRFFWRK